MKQTGRSVMLALLLLVFGAVSSNAQVVVRVRPHRPKVVVVRPPQPSPRHIWIEEDWRPSGRSYRWRGGYWAAPPRAHAAWIPGHWAHRRHGWVWIRGHWR